MWALVEPMRAGKVARAAFDERLIADTMRLFVDETRDFLAQHFPQIKPRELLHKLLSDADVMSPIPVEGSEERTPAEGVYAALKNAVGTAGLS
jgi:hypothetical protein